MKIGILTYHLSHNYGAFLQAYALVMKIKEEFPHDTVELINFNMCVADKYYKKVILSENHLKTIKYNYDRYRAFMGFKRLLPVSETELHSDSIEDFCKMVKGQYDIIIVGSDEIWRLTGSRGFPNPYWLPGDLECVKLSYAASSRSDFSKLDSNKREELKGLLNDFYHISVRDQYTYDNVVSVINDKSKVSLDCDPSFLYDFRYSPERGKKLLKSKFNVDSTKPTIGFMLTDTTTVKKIESQLGKEFNYVSLFQKHVNTFSCPNISPFEWIDIVSGLDFFVSSFFHGVCFSIITNTPFISMEKNKVNSDTSKVVDLLERLKLSHLYYSNSQLVSGELSEYIKNHLGEQVNYRECVITLRQGFLGLVETINKLEKSKL